MPIPTLATNRLILRAQTLDDFRGYAAMRTDPDVMRQMGEGKTMSEEESWASFLRLRGMWHFMGFGVWAIEEKSSGVVIGEIGFADRKRDRGEELKGLPEIGYALAPAAFGKGYATEALQAALAWGHETLGPIRVIALTTEANIASMRVLENVASANFAVDYPPETRACSSTECFEDTLGAIRTASG